MSDKDDADSNVFGNERVAAILPSPMQLCQIALSLLQLGIVKREPADPEDLSYDYEYDPLVYDPNYKRAIIEAMKVWRASVEELETHCPGLFIDLLESIFEPPDVWEEKYRRFTNQGWFPDEILFRHRRSLAAVAQGIYKDTKYSSRQKETQLKRLVKQSREQRVGRWPMSEWERKLLADPRNRLVPSPVGASNQMPKIPITAFNGIEIRALIEMRPAAKSVSSSNAGKAGGRPKKKV